jgi:hypothetical protein
MLTNNKSVDNDKKRKSTCSKKEDDGIVSVISVSTGTSTNSSKKRKTRMFNKKKSKGSKASVCSLSSTVPSDSSSSIHTSSWLPPISSLMLPTLGISSYSPPTYIKKGYYPEQFNYHEPLYGYVPQFKQVPQPKPTVMPMIPYFFHHKQFGIQACMLQLEEQRRQQMQRRHHYATNVGNHNYFYYF